MSTAHDAQAESLLRNVRREAQFLGEVPGKRHMIDGATRVIDQGGVSSAVLADAYSLRSWARKEIGDAAGALRDLDERIELGGDYPTQGLHLAESHLRRARLRLAGNDVAGAQADSDWVIDHAKVDFFRASGFCLRGMARARKGDLIGARADLERGLSLGADQEDVGPARAALAGLPEPASSSPVAEQTPKKRWWNFWSPAESKKPLSEKAADGPEPPTPSPEESRKKADALAQEAIRLANSHGGKYVDSCLDLLRQAVEIYPRHQLSLKDLGIEHQKRGNFALAAQYLLLAVEHAVEPLGDSSVAEFKLNLLDRVGTCLSNLGRFQEAAEIWERVLREGTWSANAAFQIRQDIAAARAKAQGRPAPRRTYGPPGQGEAGLNRVLGKEESKELAEATLRGAGTQELLAMALGWNFAPEDANHLIADARTVARAHRQIFAGLLGALGAASPPDAPPAKETRGPEKAPPPAPAPTLITTVTVDLPVPPEIPWDLFRLRNLTDSLRVQALFEGTRKLGAGWHGTVDRVLKEPERLVRFDLVVHRENVDSIVQEAFRSHWTKIVARNLPGPEQPAAVPPSPSDPVSSGDKASIGTVVPPSQPVPVPKPFLATSATSPVKIRITCSNERCRSPLSVAATALGKRVTCPKCRSVFVAEPSKPSSPPSPTPVPVVRMWHVAHGNKKAGPYGLSGMRELAAGGRLQPGDMVLEHGGTKWRTAMEVPGLFDPDPKRAPTAPKEINTVVRAFFRRKDFTPAVSFTCCTFCGFECPDLRVAHLPTLLDLLRQPSGIIVANLLADRVSNPAETGPLLFSGMDRALPLGSTNCTRCAATVCRHCCTIGGGCGKCAPASG